MGLTLEDLYNQCDYLVDEHTGLSIYFAKYDNEDEEHVLDLEFDDGETCKQLPLDTMIEPTATGTILLDGEEYRAYVATQVKFEPTKD